MIKFVVDKDKVDVYITTGICNKHYRLSIECSGEVHAHLLQQHLSKRMVELIASARREEYERGYRDGRSKKRKLDWFKGYI